MHLVFPDNFKNVNFPWQIIKFSDISLTLNKYFFPWLFADMWQTWLLNMNYTRNRRVCGFILNGSPPCPNPHQWLSFPYLFWHFDNPWWWNDDTCMYSQCALLLNLLHHKTTDFVVICWLTPWTTNSYNLLKRQNKTSLLSISYDIDYNNLKLLQHSQLSIICWKISKPRGGWGHSYTWKW